MSALVGYGSSDEDEHDGPQTSEVETTQTKPTVQQTPGSKIQNEDGEPAQPTVHDHKTTALGPMSGPVMEPGMDPSDNPFLSPYSADRAELMELTMPPVPNFDIPESPPGSPDPALEKKLDQFAQLKKQGMHFNERLANSASVKNPNLFNKLMSSMGIEDDQYATSLSKDIWDPEGFPDWASRDGLARAQNVAQKKRKEAAREAGRVEFAAQTKAND